jgi:hypothetical protein
LINKNIRLEEALDRVQPTVPTAGPDTTDKTLPKAGGTGKKKSKPDEIIPDPSKKSMPSELKGGGEMGGSGAPSTEKPTPENDLWHWAGGDILLGKQEKTIPTDLSMGVLGAGLATGALGESWHPNWVDL